VIPEISGAVADDLVDAKPASGERRTRDASEIGVYPRGVDGDRRGIATT
jgi:hypothetical protein